MSICRFSSHVKRQLKNIKKIVRKNIGNRCLVKGRHLEEGRNIISDHNLDKQKFIKADWLPFCFLFISLSILCLSVSSSRLYPVGLRIIFVFYTDVFFVFHLLLYICHLCRHVCFVLYVCVLFYLPIFVFVVFHLVFYICGLLYFLCILIYSCIRLSSYVFVYISFVFVFSLSALLILNLLFSVCVLGSVFLCMFLLPLFILVFPALIFLYIFLVSFYILLCYSF